MNHNANKYYLPENKELSESQKLGLAKALLELERQGVIEWRDGAWQLVTGVEIEETSDGPAARFLDTDDGSN
jgi:hypothetical protein